MYLGRLAWTVVRGFLNCAGESDVSIEDKTFALSLKSNFFAEGSASLDLHC